MIWVYLVWLVLLVGASIGFYTQNSQYRQINHKNIKLTPQQTEELSLQIMAKVASNFYKNNLTTTTEFLSEKLLAPQTIIEEVIEKLQSSQLLLNESEKQIWVLGKPIEQISLYEIIKASRTNQTETLKIKSEYGSDIDSTLKEKFENQSLKSLI